MTPKFLLHLLSARSKGRRSQSGFSMLAGILIILALVAGTVGLTVLTANNLLGSRKQDTRSDALSVAEAGADQIISVLNQTENRKMLVSGQGMNQWSTADFTSPCRDKDNNTPGAPTATARNFGDGKFRDLATLAVNTGDRRFALKSVTFSAGKESAADRRSESITTTPAGITTTKGSFSSDLINLQDPPDTPSTKLPGYNKGYITLTVESQVLKNGVVKSTATVTREFEVLPKCCGASLGSGGSGGLAASIGSDPTQSLGGESRFCGVEFGMIAGLNGGTVWSNAANDRFTKRVSSTKVTSILNILGIVAKDGDPFDRASNRVVPNKFSTDVPDVCDPARWFGSSKGCSSSWIGLANASPSAFYGTKDDILGLSISGIPIIPSAITLPTIGSEVTAGKYAFVWSSGGGPAQRVDPSIDGGQRYPTLNPSGSGGFRFRFRTRNDTNPPRIEVCNASPTTIGGTGFPCTNTDWTTISGTADTVENLEDFKGMTGGSTASTRYRSAYTNSTKNAHPNWVNVSNWQWYALDRNNNDTNAGNGRVRLVSTGGGDNNIQIGVGGSMSAQQNAICRPADLSGNLGRATLSFNQSGSAQVDATDELWVQVRTGSASSTAQCTGSTGTNITNSWVTVAKFPGVNSGTETRVVSLADYQDSDTRIRIINGTATGNNETHYIDDINLRLSDWCEYSASSPASAAPGFHCLGPIFNLDPDSSNLTGGFVTMDASGGPISFYYNRTDDLRGSSYSTAKPANGSSPLITIGSSAAIELVKCAGGPSNTCSTPVPETEVALVGDPDNLNFFGRDSGSIQVVRFGILPSGSGGSATGRIAGAWFYMPVGYFEMRTFGCAGFPSASAAQRAIFNSDDGWIFSGRIWTQSFKPCGDVHIRVPPSSASNLGAVIAASSLLDDINFVPWVGEDWVARSVTNSRPY
ncbi:hypothetical protein [Cyanobium gracile]|uniref:hypothetical protein n=1 Tax=Cyanobium gracile TaxID=59930 RepID=UPI002B20FBB8|nr:hypothetical protein [Cyanobium gracile]